MIFFFCCCCCSSGAFPAAAALSFLLAVPCSPDDDGNGDDDDGGVGGARGAEEEEEEDDVDGPFLARAGAGKLCFLSMASTRRWKRRNSASARMRVDSRSIVFESSFTILVPPWY